MDRRRSASETQPNSAEISTEKKQDRVSGGITHQGYGVGGVDENTVLHVAGGECILLLVRKSWPCCSGCGGWWRRPLVRWSVPSCQILLLVAGARLAGPSRKGASVWPSSAAAVAVLAGCNSTRCPDSQQGIPAAPCTLRIRRHTHNPDCRLGFI